MDTAAYSDQMRKVHTRFILNSIHAVTNQRAGSAFQTKIKQDSPHKHQRQVEDLTKAIKALRRALEAADDSATASAVQMVMKAVDFFKSNALVALKAVKDQDVDGHLEFILDHYETKTPETVISDLL